jgi:hypothetical protein
MKKALKQKILETVSTIRTLFVKIKVSGDRKTSEINNLTKKVDKLETELKQSRDRQAKILQAPSTTGSKALEELVVTEHSPPSTDTTLELTEVALRHVALPTEKTSRSYATAVRETKITAFKIRVKSKSACSPDSIKQLLKANINPSEINVGVKTFKSCNRGVIIETSSKEEIETLDQEMRAKCGNELEAHVYTKRKPRLITINVPEDISTNNIEDAIIRQNPDLRLQKGNIVPKMLPRRNTGMQ